MLTIGIRELKNNPSVVLRRVRQKGETVAVTFRGVLIARITPVEDATSSVDDAGWVELDELSAKIGRQLKKKPLKRRAIASSDIRRDL